MSTPSNITSQSPNGNHDTIAKDEVALSPEVRSIAEGRGRPVQFRGALHEVAFVCCMAASPLLAEYFISGWTVIAPSVQKSLHIPDSSATWPATSFTLALSATLLPLGRLVDIYGGTLPYVAGAAWLCVWSIIAGFSTTEILLNVSRAMQGVGAAAYLGASLSLLGAIYRPGRRMNIIFSIYGGTAPLGFFLGILIASITAQFLPRWGYYFWIGTIPIGLTGATACLTIPSDVGFRRDHSLGMDWLGGLASMSGLALFLFSIADSGNARSGWRTPYIYVSFILGVISLLLAYYVEGWVAQEPLIPFSMFRIRSMGPLCLALLFGYGTLGLYLVYTNLYLQDIMNVSPILLPAWYAPVCVGGFVLSIVGGFILHCVPGTVILVCNGLFVILAALLFALIPQNGGYWAWVFPAMVSTTLAIDLMFNVGNIYLSMNLSPNQQGLAGALGNLLLYLGISLLLGFAEIVETSTAYQGRRLSYKNVFWFELACGGVATFIFLAFVRIKYLK